MKFFRTNIRYEEIFYDMRKSLAKTCLDLNSENWNHNDDIHVIVCQVASLSMEMICAVENPLTKENVIMERIRSYVVEINQRISILQIGESKIEDLKEITLNTFCDLLDEYSFYTLIEDKESIRETIGVNNGCKLYKEELLDVNNMKTESSPEYFFDKKEKKRIKYGRRLNEPVIAPIHYVIYEDDDEIKNSICKELIGYLWDQGRICNRRKVVINDDDVLENLLRKKVYNLNSLVGGVLILKLSSDVEIAKKYLALVSEDKNNTYSNKFTIIILAKTTDIEGYNNAIKECFYSVAFYPILNQRLNRRAACKYFEQLISKHGVISETDSWKNLLDKKEYTYYEVGKIYKKWFRNSCYVDQRFKQYSDVIENYFKEENMNTGENARIELEKLIGLDTVKKLILEIIDYHKISGIRNEMDMIDKASSMHMAFMGNPGTAKTTVARIIAKILKDEGILKKGELIEVGRADLVGKYVGWTAKNIKEYFQKARGSVLFIDEAYSLLDGQNSFGDEAINTIVQEMENMRTEVVVIMAGYKKDMADFINRNSGMRSRIKFFVDFPDYSNDEMYKILECLAKNEGIIIEPDVKNTFIEIISKKEYLNGNGRSVRNIYEKAKMKQARRIMTLNRAEVKKEINILKQVDFCEL